MILPQIQIPEEINQAVGEPADNLPPHWSYVEGVMQKLQCSRWGVRKSQLKVPKNFEAGHTHLLQPISAPTEVFAVQGVLLGGLVQMSAAVVLVLAPGRAPAAAARALDLVPGTAPAAAARALDGRGTLEPESRWRWEVGLLRN